MSQKLKSLLDQVPDECQPLLGRLLAASAEHSDLRDYLNTAISQLADHLRSAVVLTSAEGGQWHELATSGDSSTLPPEVLAEAADQAEPVSLGEWMAMPLELDPFATSVLAVQKTGSLNQDQFHGAAAALLAAGLDAQQRYQSARRLSRLETILEITQDWNRTREMEPLLNAMANAATRLLSAERASIFLWDRPRKTLVGRPALGVEGGELRIADDAGIVGQVVQTGQSRRIRSADASEVDRQVDQQLKFLTRNLVCVPLTTHAGQQLGAFEVLNKNEGEFSEEDEQALTELAAHASVALANTQQVQELVAAQDRLVDQAAAEIKLIGQSPAVEAMRGTITRVADTDLAVLVLGENGTGKEVACRMLHYLSRRRSEPFVAVNCAALTETLLESELFGHERGAFTDAYESRAGKFEVASGGTFFLDEIGDLSLGGQAKLLRVLEEKVVVRVGGTTTIETDVRVLAATNQDLGAMVREKSFREDLFFRLNVVTLEMPPLRERGEDIVLLAEHFLKQFCQKAGRRVPKLSAAASKRLMSHRWPGNIRELRNLAERLAYLLPDERLGHDIAATDLAFVFSPQAAAGGGIESDLPLSEATRRFQVDFIQQTIDSTHGNMSEAAVSLGLHRSNLYRKMHQLEMSTSDEDSD